MRLRIFSDLHTEFADFDPPPVDCDAVILAGDIGVGLGGLVWAREVFPHEPIIYVPGNHEYYGQVYPLMTRELRRIGLDRDVYVLDTDAVTLDGVRFLGATLWTDLNLHGVPGAAELRMKRGMSDFRRILIAPRRRPLAPRDTLRCHWQARRWLEDAFARPHDGPTVVITHHAPSPRSLPERFRDDPLAPGYASHMEHLVQTSGAAMWIHGHCHARRDYALGATRVVCNPRGYPDESTGFDPALVVEIPEVC